MSGVVADGQNIWRIPFFWFTFYTGMRGEETAKRRWDHIDVKKCLIYIRKQKNRKEQTIPLNLMGREVLEDLGKGRPSDYVFRSPSFDGLERNPKWFRENVSTAFREAREETGLREEPSFHSLLHGSCTALAEAGKSAVVTELAPSVLLCGTITRLRRSSGTSVHKRLQVAPKHTTKPPERLPTHVLIVCIYPP